MIQSALQPNLAIRSILVDLFWQETLKEWRPLLQMPAKTQKAVKWLLDKNYIATKGEHYLITKAGIDYLASIDKDIQ